jgi:hypothetical protein
VYTQHGALGGAELTITWVQSNTDAVSLAMAGDYKAATIFGQFYNLGSALLERA